MSAMFPPGQQGPTPDPTPGPTPGPTPVPAPVPAPGPHDPYAQGPWQHGAFPPPPPRKPRPRAGWFLGPALLIALAIAVAVVTGVLFWNAMTTKDATVPRDGAEHSVTLPDTQKRMIWERQGDPVASCRVTDQASGEELVLRFAMGTYTRNTGSGEMRGTNTFVPTSESIVIRCAADGGSPVEIGEAPQIAGLVGGMFAGIAGALILGGVGLIWGIVLLVLFFSRPKRAV